MAIDVEPRRAELHVPRRRRAVAEEWRRAVSRLERVIALGLWTSLAATLAGCEGCKKPGDTADGSAATVDAAVINATPVPTASVMAMINPDKLPPYSGPTGGVEGTISVVGDPAPDMPKADFRCAGAEKAWGKLFREGAPTSGGARPLADAVVAVTGYKGFYVPEKNEARTVVIDDCAYKNLTVTLTYGQRLEVKNLTNEFWTPLLEPGTHIVMMMASPKGDPVRIYPKKWGRHLLVDRDRKYVGVDVYVFLHALHTASDVDGRYRIDGLPVGKVTVNARHPHFDGETSVDLEVRENVIHKVDLTLRYERGDAGPPERPDAGYHPTLR